MSERINVRGSNQSAAIFRPLGKQDEVVQQEDDYSVAYDKNLQEVDDDDDTAICKDILTNDKHVYSIKVNKRGSLLNPYDMYEEDRHNRVSEGRKNWEFRKVSKKSFDYYVEFLKTKNQSWLRNAEREIV